MNRKISGEKLFPFARHPLLFGHRGCSKAFPENTLAAFKGILDYGIPGVELDVHMCGTGELVVIHDFNTKRTTGVDSVIEKTSYEEIRRMDAGSFFSPEFKGERIPMLEEVLDLLGTQVYYDIEIKHENLSYGPLEKKLLGIIERYGITDRVIISSFNPIAVKGVKKMAPEIPTAVIYSKSPRVPFILRRGAGRFIAKPDILKPSKSQVTGKLVSVQKKRKKYGIIAWVEDEEQEAERLLKMGIDGIVSNQPEKLTGIVQKYYSAR